MQVEYYEPAVLNNKVTDKCEIGARAEKVVNDEFKDLYSNLVDHVQVSRSGGQAASFNWITSHANYQPIDMGSGGFYKGINNTNLQRYMSTAADGNNVPDCRFISVEKAREAGLGLKKGSKPVPVIFFQGNDTESDDKIEQDDGQQSKASFMLVYHMSSFENAPPMPELQLPSPFEYRQFLDDFIGNTGIKTNYTLDNICDYDRTNDVVTMVHKELFSEPDVYYGVHFHELMHACDHEARLNVRLPSDNEELCFVLEELRAEIGTMLLSKKLFVELPTKLRLDYLGAYLGSIPDQDKEILVINLLYQAHRAADYLIEQSGLDSVIEAHQEALSKMVLDSFRDQMRVQQEKLLTQDSEPLTVSLK